MGVNNSDNTELLQIFLEDARDGLTEWEKVCLNLTPADEAAAIGPILRCAHNLKGGAGLIGLNALHERLHRFEDHLTALRDQKVKFTPEVIDLLLKLENFFRNWIEKLKTDFDYNPDSTALEAALLQLTFKSGARDAAAIPSQEPAAIKPGQKRGRAAPETAREDETLRVSAAKLDHLIQLVGELSLHHSILERASREGHLNHQAVRAVIDIKSKLNQDLQDTALSLRMVPLDGLFQRAERVARETAAKLKKLVAVTRRGDDATLDKIVVERMHEPLIHLARNAVDHGIESVEERKALGKPPVGTVKLSAETTTSGVTIIFEDDGRGIDAAKIHKKAIARGLVNPAQELSPAAQLQLIFIPGLSTAENVTEISGRGVGMDVVSEVVRRMGGKVEVSSVLGQGTRFTISLPTNLSILDALVVRVAGCQYAIPNQDLSEVVNLSELEAQPVKAGRGQAMNLRGQIIPIENMATFLRHTHPDAAKAAFDDQKVMGRPGVIVHFRDLALALAVDQVIGQQQIFVRPVIESLAAVTFFSGSTILSDGEPSMILNLSEMAREYFEHTN